MTNDQQLAGPDLTQNDWKTNKSTRIKRSDPFKPVAIKKRPGYFGDKFLKWAL